MVPAAAHCALHPGEPAALACLRCGTFSCARCSPAPSVLCGACAERVGDVADGWARVPDLPARWRRIVRSPLTLYVLVTLALVVRQLWPARPAALVVVLALALVTLAAGLFRLAEVARTIGGRRGLRAAARAMSAQRYAQAAVAFEETLRGGRLDPESRVLGLYIFAATAASAGLVERARGVLEKLVPSAWRDIGRASLLRGQGQVVLAVVRALAGDLGGAREARQAARVGPLARLFYSPAYGDAVIAARAGDPAEALARAQEAHRFARRFRLEGLARSTSVIEAFAREALGQDEGAVESALAPARFSPPGAHDGLRAVWPAMQDFLARRIPDEAPATTEDSVHGTGGSPLTPGSPLR